MADSTNFSMNKLDALKNIQHVLEAFIPTTDLYKAKITLALRDLELIIDAETLDQRSVARTKLETFR